MQAIADNNKNNSNRKGNCNCNSKARECEGEGEQSLVHCPAAAKHCLRLAARK